MTEYMVRVKCVCGETTNRMDDAFIRKHFTDGIRRNFTCGVCDQDVIIINKLQI